MYFLLTICKARTAMHSIVVCATECPTQMMTSSEGSFHSPAFPQQYPRYTYCVWTITVQQGYMVQLSFTDFGVGQWSNYICYGAYLRLYDGNSVDASNVLDTYVDVGFNTWKPETEQPSVKRKLSTVLLRQERWNSAQLLSLFFFFFFFLTTAI